MEISVEVKRGGASLQGSNATVTVEMVHPIGFVMNTSSWSTTPLLGSQSSQILSSGKHLLLTLILMCPTMSCPVE